MFKIRKIKVMTFEELSWGESELKPRTKLAGAC
jgi:hypothetical protein